MSLSLLACGDITLVGSPEGKDDDDSTEDNIIGMYESDGGHGTPAGTTTVQINRSGPMVLMLSSYEPVIWELTLAAIQAT